MAYALQSMLKIRGLRENHAQAELVQAKAVQSKAESELQARADARVEYESEKEERRDRVFAAVIGRTVKMDDLDLARSAVTRIDEEGILLAEAERKARVTFEEKRNATERARDELVAATRNLEKIVQHRRIWEEEDRRSRERIADAEMDEFAEIRRRNDRDDID